MPNPSASNRSSAPRRAIVTWAAAAVLATGFLSAASAQSPPGPSTQAADGASPTGRLTGTVTGRFEDRVTPLRWAVVEVTADRVVRSVITDESGRYEVDGLGAGPLRVRASHAGHASVSLGAVLSAGGRLAIDLELTARPLALPGLDVETGHEPVAPDDLSDPVFGEDPALALELLELGPGVGHAGIVDAVSSLPGNDPADPSDVLLMRGSTTEMKLVLLDGVPVVTPFHVGGLLAPFEPGVLGSARLHLGGAPARYDGGLTHVLDLRTRTPRRDRVRASAALDLLSSRAATEVPLGNRAGVLAAGRVLHDVGQAPWGGASPYGYGDLLVTVDAEPAEAMRLRGTGFWNRESVRLDYADGPTRAEWGNRAGSLRLGGTAGDARIDVSLGASGYDARLPLRPSATEENPDPSPVLATQRMERVRAVAEIAWGSAGAPFRAGVSFEDLTARYAATAEDTGLTTADAGRGTVAGLFGEVERPLGNDVHLRVGARVDFFREGGARLSPRGSLSFGLGGPARLTLAAGRYHQVVTSGVRDVDAPADLDAPASSGLLPVARADHVMLTLEQRLGASVALGLDGYWKRFDDAGGPGDSPILNSGIDLRLKRSGDRLAAWMGYGLAWFWTTEAFTGAATEFTGRHLLSAGVSGTLAGPLRAEASLAYGAGLPSTSIPFGAMDGDLAPVAEQLTGGFADEPDDFRMLASSFLRLDLQLHARFTPEWAGHRWRVSPYIRLLNPLDRRDALFYAYRPREAGSVVPLGARPVLPVLGIAFSY